MLSLSKTKTFQFLITAGNILFLLLYSILVYYNRYAADDYFFEYNARSRGIWGGIVYQYNAWTGRPAETFLLNVLATFFSEHMVLMIYGVSALLLLFLAIFKLTQFILNRLSLEISTFLILNFSLLFCCLFFFLLDFYWRNMVLALFFKRLFRRTCCTSLGTLFSGQWQKKYPELFSAYDLLCLYNGRC